MRAFLIYTALDSPQKDGYSQGLGTISAVLKMNGHSVSYIVLKNKDDIATLYGRCQTERPDVVAFSVTTNQFDYLRDICPSIKEKCDALILCGGIHPTLSPECIHEIPAIDAIIIGEGEYPMLELADVLDSGKDPTRISNFWFRKDGEVIRNEVRPLIENLDLLPFADKESVDFQAVIDAAGGMLRISLGRGCPFDCSFCCNKALAETYPNGLKYSRMKSPRLAIEEIKRDEQRFKFSKITFDDDLITLNKKWFHEFFELYCENFNYRFVCNLRPGTIGKDEVLLLKRAGVELVYIGVEHGHQEFRKRVLKRNMSNESIIETFHLLHEQGIACHANLLMGLPYETKMHFLETVRLSRRLGLAKDNLIGIFYPFPGTQLGEICKEKRWMPTERKYKDIARATINSPCFPKNEIFRCEQAFSVLLKYKFLPLRTPFSILWAMDSVERRLKDILGHLYRVKPR